MTEDKWKKMERVIPVAPWTYLNMGGDKEEREGNEDERTNEQVTGLEQMEQSR